MRLENQLICRVSDPVSSEYIISRVLLSLTSSYCWPNFTHPVTMDLKFGSCTALSSSSPVIEASKLVTVEVESRFQTPSLRLRRLHRCGLYTVHALY
jgi:hypothetical protein